MIIEIGETYSCEIESSIFVPLIILCYCDYLWEISLKANVATNESMAEMKCEH